jgi:hypothetical protein
MYIPSQDPKTQEEQDYLRPKYKFHAAINVCMETRNLKDLLWRKQKQPGQGYVWH